MALLSILYSPVPGVILLNNQKSKQLQANLQKKSFFYQTYICTLRSTWTSWLLIFQKSPVKHIVKLETCQDTQKADEWQYECWSKYLISCSTGICKSSALAGSTQLNPTGKFAWTEISSLDIHKRANGWKKLTSTWRLNKTHRTECILNLVTTTQSIRPSSAACMARSSWHHYWLISISSQH